MSEFSKKYNIKIENAKNIMEFLSFCDNVNIEKEYKIAQLYFVNNKIDLNEISKFSDINDYAIITSDDLKKEVKLYNESVYTTSLTDVLTVSKLLYIFGYEVIFSINRTVYKYLYNDNVFYIQYIKNKGYFLTFDESIDDNTVNEVFKLLREKINFALVSNMYYNIEEEIFIENK